MADPSVSAPEGVDPKPPVPLDESEPAAAREALRIAVEGLEECGRYERPAVPRGYTHVVALAAVRELVDLGGNDGP